MLITDKGVMIRFGIEKVSETGRATLGVHLIKMDADSTVATMAKVEKEAPEEVEVTTTDETTSVVEPAEADPTIAKAVADLADRELAQEQESDNDESTDNE